MKKNELPKKIIKAKKKPLKKGAIKEFDMISANNSFSLCNRVNSLIKDGWQPYGHIFICNEEFCLGMSR